MGDSLNIHSLLETGYFTTSRARAGASSVPQGSFSITNDLAESGAHQSPGPASPPSPLPDSIPDPFLPQAVPRLFEKPREPQKPSESAAAPARPVSLPPPTVEDEVESLAKEHGSPPISDHPEEHPQSRGQFQQESIMEEVHEHNPERRFVVVKGQPKSDSSGSDDDAHRPKKTERRTSRRPSLDGQQPNLKPDRRREPSYAPVFDDQRDADLPAPGLTRRRSERRKSRHELPRIDTGSRAEQPSGRPRTKSAVGGPRPDFFEPDGSRQHGNSMLSPEVIKHGSSRREQPYHGYGSSASPNGRPGNARSLSHTADERSFEAREYSRGNLSPTAPKRSGPNYNSGTRDSRHFSTDKSSEPRVREEFPAHRSHRREGSKSHVRSDEPPLRGPSTGRSREPRPRREDSRSSDERSRDARISTRRRRDSVVIQDERRSMPNLVNGAASSPAVRPPSRGSNLPLASPKVSVSSDLQSSDGRNGLAGAAAVAAGAAGVAALGAEALKSRNTNLPYPEEDFLLHSPGPAPPKNTQTYPEIPSSYVPPDAPTIAHPSAETLPEPPATITVATPAPTPPLNSTAWQPSSFIPERDGLPVEKPMGAYRRYSENVDSSGGPPRLPECHYIKPVTGIQNWLTLPRSDFNICTGCYTAVFADTDYRTHFQPMLYAADRPIACDFGSSPWYRIAWLLTLRNEMSDLRLFYAISHIATTSRNQPCPGDRKSTRVWLTIIDPYTRRPIPNFAVCVQCAQTVEALLPNMKGIFVPLDPRSEPSRNVCALHFTPKRSEFVMYFDALETASDKALLLKQPPDLDALSQELEKLCSSQECPRDDPVPDGYWHVMQYLPDFTVCEKCFSEVVRPRINEEGVLARNFYQKPQRVANATCQLYSDRMRDVFRRACRRSDTEYLAMKVHERARKENEIHSRLLKLDRKGHDPAWTAEQVKKLVDEWKEWE